MGKGPNMHGLATSPWAGPQHFRAAYHISSGPQVGKLATSHLWGSPKLQGRMQNQN